MPIEVAGSRESEWEGYPDAQDAQPAWETEGVTHRQRDDEISDEGISNHRLHAGDAPQGIGKGILQSVAKLVYHHQDNQHCHVLLHLHIVGEEPAYLVAEEEHGDAHQRGEKQCQSPSIIGIAAHGLIIFLPHKVAHTYRHSRSHAREHQIEELRDGNHHLMGGKRYGAQPAHHHATQRKGSRLHRQLQCHRPAQAVHLLEVSLVHMAMDDVLAILLELLLAQYHRHHCCRHQDARAHSGESGTEQTQLREWTYAVDEHPVAQDVDHVAHNHHPHRHLGMSDTVQKLLHRIEYTHEEHRDQIHDEVRADEGEQFLGLSDTREIEVEYHHRQGEDAAHNHVGEERIAHLLTYLVGALHAIESADDRGESVREAHVRDEYEGIDVVDESCRRQFLSAMMTYHERVGEAKHDCAELSDDDRYADGE